MENPIIILDNISLELIQKFKEQKAKRIEVNTILEHLEEKQILIKPINLEILYQNIISVKLEGDKRYYELRVD